jgi:hypothetical protein
MRVSIQYDGTSLQTSNIISQEFEHESLSGKTLDLQRLASRDGGKLLSVTFAPRVIRVRGRLSYTTQSSLETGIDSFKQLLNRSQKHLDIGYAGETRRYTIETAQITLLRHHWQTTYADFEAEFVTVKTPFGFGLDTTTADFNTIESVATYAGSFVASGTYKPNPRIEVTFTEVAGVDGVTVRNTSTGDFIRHTNGTEYLNSDALIFDTDQYTVTLNAVAQDYSGFFPSFRIGGNDLRISFQNGIHYKATVKVIYYQLYL